MKLYQQVVCAFPPDDPLSGRHAIVHGRHEREDGTVWVTIVLAGTGTALTVDERSLELALSRKLSKVVSG